MNFDDKNNASNSDNQPQPWIDPELEARVVALVLGEASAFEAAELERLLQEKPELAIFKRRIEAVHGLLGEAVQQDKAPLKMSEERRAQLLATLGAGAPGRSDNSTTPQAAAEAEASQKKVVAYPLESGRTQSARRWRRAMAVAAGLMIGLTVSTTVWYSQRGRNEARMAYARPQSEVVVPKELSRDGITLADSPRQASDALAPLEPAAPPQVVEAIPPPPQNVAGMRAGADHVASSAERVEATVSNPATAPTTQDVVQMGPFVVRGEKEGNATALASSTLAGSRITTNLKNQVGVITFPPSEPRSMPAQNGLTGQNYAFEPSVQVAADANAATRGLLAPGVGTEGINEAARLDGIKDELRKRRVTRFVADVDAKAQPSTWGNSSVNQKKTDTFTFGAKNEPDSLDKEIGSGSPLARLKKPRPTVSFYVNATGGGAADATSVAQSGASPATSNSYAANDSEVIQLSPFSVATGADKGYQAPKGGALQRQRGRVGADAPTRLAEAKPKRPAPSDTVLGPASTAGEALAAGGVVAQNSPATPGLAMFTEVPEKDTPLRREPRVVDNSLAREVPTAQESVSTFSLHVSDVSFRLAQADLARGQMPDPASIRPEEFYNAFNYGDLAPLPGERVSCRIEQSAHPFLQQRNLLRIAVKVPSTGRAASTSLRLTVLLDRSGSMEREDRAAAVRRALESLVSLLGPNDRLTLIGFARTPRLLAEDLPGDQAKQALDLLTRTPAEGGTNFEEALKLAGELAQRHELVGAQNRIVMLTDGAANLGNADPEKLAASVEALRQQGIAFDACGVGLDGIDDSMLEALTRKGDGRYYVLNTPEAADEGFARQLAGAFRPAAQNVKVQVRFNPSRVAAYRLIGFEQHRLKTEDFRNDSVDAAELAADEAANALYQIEPLPQGQGEIGEVYVRFRDVATGAMVERSWTLLYNPQAPAFDRAPPSLQLASLAAFVADKLRGGPAAEAIRLEDLSTSVATVRAKYANEPRVQQLAQMIEQLRRMQK